MKTIIKNNWKAAVFSLIFALCLCLQKSIIDYNSELGFLTHINILKTIMTFIILFILIFIGSSLIIKYICKLKFAEIEYSKKDIKKIFIISFISMLIIWSICFITFFPGASLSDTYFQFSQPVKSAAQHPIGYNLLLHFFIVTIGFNLLHNVVIGWALLSVFQMLFIAASISFALCFLAKRKISKVVIAILILIYSLMPIYAIYSIYAIKDVLYSVLLLYLVLLIIKLVESNGEMLRDKFFITFYIIIFILMFITRNNTIVIYLITTIAITIKYYKKWNILITLLLIPLVFNCLLNTFLDKKYGVEHYFQESVSIPLQQISSTVHIDGNLNKNEKEYINSLLELDIMRENYHPGLIDTIKWNTNFNRDYLQKTKMKFLRTWGSIMIKNFDTYIESHMLQTYCFWTLNSKAYVPNMYHKSSRNDYKMPYINQIKEYYNFSYINLLPQKIQKPLEKFYQKYVSLISEGLCFWLFIFSMLVLSYKRRNVLLIGIPLFSLWLSIMLATPISGSLRYVFPFFIVLPILIGYILNVKIDDSRR